MGSTHLQGNTETVHFYYTIFDSESNEWVVLVKALVSLGSPDERDEKMVRYDGDQPSVEELNMYWSFSGGKDVSVVHRAFMPTPMIKAIEAKAISLANEQAFQDRNS